MSLVVVILKKYIQNSGNKHDLVHGIGIACRVGLMLGARTCI